MNDRYSECLVAQRTKPVYMIGMVLCGFLALVCLMGIYLVSILAVIPALAFGGLAVYCWLHTSLEYEYLLLDRNWSADRIQARSRRKTVFSVSVKNIELLAPADSPKCETWYRQKIGILDMSTGENAGKYLMVCRTDGKVQGVYLTPNASMLDQFEMELSRLVFTR